MHTRAGRSDFPTTRWTLVLAAGDPQQKEARSALVALCEGYWYPLYAYVRRRGYPVDQAQDLTQEFLLRVLDGRYLDRADPEKGRFRAYILTSLKFFLADEADRSRAQKRDVGSTLSLEISSGEERLSARPCTRRDAGAGLRAALGAFDARRRDRQTAGGIRAAWTPGPLLFDRKEFASRFARGSMPYAALAREIGTSEGALKVAIHRFRKRYTRQFVPRGDRPRPSRIRRMWSPSSASSRRCCREGNRDRAGTPRGSGPEPLVRSPLARKAQQPGVRGKWRARQQAPGAAERGHRFGVAAERSITAAQPERRFTRRTVVRIEVPARRVPRVRADCSAAA